MLRDGVFLRQLDCKRIPAYRKAILALSSAPPPLPLIRLLGSQMITVT